MGNKAEIFVDGVVLEFPATGVVKTLLNLYEASFKINPSIKFTVLHRKPLKYSLPPYIHSVRWGYCMMGFWRSISLPIYSKVKKPDIIHFPWNGAVPRFLDDMNIIVTINDVLPLILPNFFESLKRENKYKNDIQTSINRANLIITISEFSKQEIVNNFDVNVPLVVIPPGPTVKLNLSKNYPKFKYFLYVGGYDPRKGIETMLRVFLKLIEGKKINQKLILTGSKNYFSTSFKKLVEKGVSSGFVEEWGYVSEETLSSLYAHATALVYPSKYEGFGLPPLEAMKVGCPVITTKKTAIPEVCGSAVYYINGENDLAESLIRLENDEKLRETLILKGKKQSAKYSWESSAEIFLNKIEELFLQ